MQIVAFVLKALRNVHSVILVRNFEYTDSTGALVVKMFGNRAVERQIPHMPFEIALFVFRFGGVFEQVLQIVNGGVGNRAGEIKALHIGSGAVPARAGVSVTLPHHFHVGFRERRSLEALKLDDILHPTAERAVIRPVGRAACAQERLGVAGKRTADRFGVCSVRLPRGGSGADRYANRWVHAIHRRAHPPGKADKGLGIDLQKRGADRVLSARERGATQIRGADLVPDPFRDRAKVERAEATDIPVFKAVAEAVVNHQSICTGFRKRGGVCFQCG